MTKKYCVVVTNGRGKYLYRSKETTSWEESSTKARAFNKVTPRTTPVEDDNTVRSAHVEDFIYVQDIPVQENL